MKKLDKQDERSAIDPPAAVPADSFKFQTSHIQAGTEISSTHAPTPFLLRSGWAFQQVVRSDGQRQILGVVLPGELFLCYSTFALTAATDCVVDFPSKESHQSFVAAYSPSPGGVDDFKTAQLWRLAFGRTTSHVRIAFLLCELARRLVPNFVDGTPIRLNIKMERHDIADICCLSTGHTIRTMHELETMKIIQRCYRGVLILDMNRLRNLAAS